MLQPVVGAIGHEGSRILRQLIHSVGDMGGVVNILVRQVKGDDLAVAGVQCQCGNLRQARRFVVPCFFKQPFAPRAISVLLLSTIRVNCARSNPREVATGNPHARRLIVV